MIKERITSMSQVHAPKMFLAILMLFVAAGMLQAQTSPLSSDHATVSLSWILGTGTGGTVTPKISAASSTYFTVDPATVPFWLSIGAMSGTAVSAGLSVTFNPSATVVPTLAVGTYSGTVHFKVSGFSDFLLPVTLAVSQAAATVSVKEVDSSNTIAFNWSQGSAYPTQTLTFISSSNPVDFTLTPASTATTTGGITNWLKVNHTSGVAYSWGTHITVSFVQAAFDAANVGDVLTGTVAVAPANGTATPTVTINITVTAPAATITRIFPAETPLQGSSPAAVNVVITGTGFYDAGSAGATAVSVGGSALGSGVTVVNSRTILVSVPGASLTSAGNLAIAVQNGSGAPSSVNLNVTASPIVYSTTDSAGVVEAAPGTNPTVAPYEMITLFGAGFLGGDSATVQATLDSFSRYPTSLTDTSALTVSFYQSNGTTLIANAYLLYASDTQLNLFVPSGVTGNVTVKFKVTFGAAVSSLYTATVAAANPGVFTTTSSGQGQGAILNQDFSANSSASKAAVGTTVMIYASGLGAPNSTGTDTASATAAAYPHSCVSPANYMAAVNNGTFTSGVKPGTAWTSLDGAVILGTNLANNTFAPCMVNTGSSAVTVSIGGKAATVTYAGWVSGSAAGLYQINAVVPATITGTVPVVVTVGGTAASQAGVTMVTP
jgi:uncharacterized protein (TIGR03437 family)